MLAWVTPSGGISTTILNFEPGEIAFYTNAITPTGFTGTPGWGPALAAQGSTLWLAWLENPAQAPLEPPSITTREPPVIMVSSSVDFGSWSTPQSIWTPGLTGSDNYVAGYAGPAAVSAPALVANGDELIAVWIELAVNGSDALELWSEGQPLETPSPQVFMSKLTSGGNWTPRSAVGNAMSYATPALAAYNGTIYMALKGHSDSNIWFMSYADGAGWTKQAQLPNFQTSAGPALATTTTGEVQMVWVGASDDDLYIASLNGGWNPDNPGHGWSEQIQIPVMRSSNQPALASQVLSTDQIPIAITGETSGSIYVAPTSSFALVSPAPKLSSNANYQFGDNGNALTGISIVIEMTEDFVLGSDGPAGPGLESFSGYSFQFNALSAPGYQVRIQQYIIELIGSQLQGTINNWPYNNTSTDWLVNNTISFANVPNSGVIPRNYKLYINLHHEKDGTVTGAEFSAYDNHMNLLGVTTNTINLPGGQIAPIVAFEMNVVGPFNSQQVTISSGEGLLTFQSNNPLTASNPSLGATGEKSNINYQALTAYPYANDTEVRRRKTVVNKAAAGSGRTDS